MGNNKYLPSERILESEYIKLVLNDTWSSLDVCCIQ
jgi:hypothetical protein